MRPVGLLVFVVACGGASQQQLAETRAATGPARPVEAPAASTSDREREQLVLQFEAMRTTQLAHAELRQRAAQGPLEPLPTVVLSVGDNKVSPVLPPGQLRGGVRSVVTGRSLAGATVTIEPGGIKTTSGADGTFTLDLAPGQYKITVSAPGLAEQQLDVTIDPNSVAIKNIELHR